MSCTIGLLGDVMLGRGVAESLRGRNPGEVWDVEVYELAASCDFLLCNLECCVSARGWPTKRIAGKPFFFRAPPAATACLALLGVRGVSLANNHALDFESEALEDTLSLLSANRIAVTGAGTDYAAARTGFVATAGTTTIGVVGVCDHPSEYRAGDPGFGVAYSELSASTPSWLVKELSRLRAMCDQVICFPHWGPNMTTTPARWQRDRASELVEAGADLIAGHSAHVFHGVEHVAGRLCAYDLGGGLDDYAVDPSLRNDLGLLALWRPEGSPELELVGLKLDYAHTALAKGESAEWIAWRLEQACSELGTTVRRIGTQRFAID